MKIFKPIKIASVTNQACGVNVVAIKFRNLQKKVKDKFSRISNNIWASIRESLRGTDRKMSFVFEEPLSNNDDNEDGLYLQIPNKYSVLIKCVISFTSVCRLRTIKDGSYMCFVHMFCL